MLDSDSTDFADTPPEPTIDGRLPLLAFVADEASEAALRGGLVERLSDIKVRRGDVRAAAKHLEKESAPRVLLVDIAGFEHPVEELERLAHVCPPDLKVLVVGDRTDIDFYRLLVGELSVSEYLPKPLTREAVERTFGRHVAGAPGDPARERGGQVIAVMGVRGGVGATTIAVNLGAHLESLTHAHIAILDLHLHRGAAALMLGIRPSAGLRVALEEPDRVDALFIDRAAAEVGERLRLIAPEESYEDEIAPTAEALARLLTLLRRKFNHIVIDLPSPPAAMRQVLTVARQRVVVLGPDVTSLRDTLSVRRLCTQLGVPRVITVLNRAGGAGALKPALIQEGLGAAPDVTIPDLARHLPRAANLGKLALPKIGALRRALEPLTLEVSGVRAHAAARSGRSLFSWLSRS